jgi:hypothetical protein
MACTQIHHAKETLKKSIHGFFQLVSSRAEKGQEALFQRPAKGLEPCRAQAVLPACGIVSSFDVP